MLQESVTNKIIANIKRSTFNTNNYINSENVIVIDSSNIRLGINTKNPQYAIDVSGNDFQSIINAKNLIITNKAQINSISCNEINLENFTLTNLDFSFGYCYSISANDISSYSLHSKNIYSSLINTIDISSNNYIYFNNLSGNTLNVNSINTNILDISAQFNLLNLNSENGIINNLSGDNLNYDNIKVIDLSANNMYINNNVYFSKDTSFTNIHVQNNTYLNELNVNDISTNNIYVNNIYNTTTISTSGSISASGSIYCGGTLFGNNITGNSLEISGNTIINNNGSIGSINVDGNFKHVQLKNLDFFNVTGAGTNFSTGYFILPIYNHNQDIASIYLDYSNNILKIYNNNIANNIFLSINYANIYLSDDLSGNDVSYNIYTQSYFIENSNNLLIDSNLNYKYIPITTADSNKISIKNNKYIYVDTSNNNNLYEIHAHVSIKYLNMITGDVEPNTYTFGIYPNYTISYYLDSPFATIQNSILAFDNSFNYSNASLSYIGSIGSRFVGGLNSRICNGFVFYINSNKDINYLVIDSFNCSIKQLT